jgi:hypothetical protein
MPFPGQEGPHEEVVDGELDGECHYHQFVPEESRGGGTAKANHQERELPQEHDEQIGNEELMHPGLGDLARGDIEKNDVTDEGNDGSDYV